MSNNSPSPTLRLSVVLPAYGGQIASEHARMWLELGAILVTSEARFQLVGFTTIDLQPIDRARNTACAIAIQQRADWLLMVDADTWAETAPGTDEPIGFHLLRMISEADRAGAVMVGAPVQRRIVPDGTTERALMVYRDELGNEPYPAGEVLGKLTEVTAIATALVAVNTRWLADQDCMFAFGTVGIGEPHGEDLMFCKRVRKLGGKILCDGRVRTAHLSRQMPLYSDSKGI